MFCNLKYKTLCSLVIVSLMLLCSAGYDTNVFAADGVPYSTWFLNSKGQIMRTQTAYIPSMIIDGFSTAAEDSEKSTTMSNPEDIFIDEKDYIYVADTGKSRIIVYDANGNCIKTIGEGVLASPSGVFVDEAGHVYVADRGKDKIFLFSSEGELKQEYGKPDSILFGKESAFKPLKVAVDKMGSMYIASAGSINGLIQLDRDGKFMGYFGGNKSSVDILRRIQRLLFTDEQLSRLSRVIPTSISNVAIDHEGLIYTATQTKNTVQPIKKFNVAGTNLLKDLMGISDSISDITIDRTGNIYAVDYKESLVIEYNRDGALVFLFGGTDIGRQQMGRFKAPSGVAVDSKGHLYILDKERNNIQVLVATEFANMVHKATALYMDGKYVESKELWEQVLTRNGMFDLAHLGIGMAEYKQQNYEKALDEFRLANNKRGYSDSYWEIRRKWIMENLPAVFISLIVFALIVSLLKQFDRIYKFSAPVRNAADRLKRRRFVADILQFTRVLRHPIDCYYEIKREKKGSIPAALFWILLLIIFTINKIYNTGYIFNSYDVRFVQLGQVLLTIIAPLTLWVACNYLVSTINDGEGSLRDVLVGSTSALMPVILFMLPLTILSNGLTLMEKVIYYFLSNLSVAWSALLMFIMVKEVHDYEIGGTIKNILLTIFLMACIIIIGIILFGLSNQLWDFVYSLYQEVRIRG